MNDGCYCTHKSLVHGVDRWQPNRLRHTHSTESKKMLIQIESLRPIINRLQKIRLSSTVEVKKLLRLVRVK